MIYIHCWEPSKNSLQQKYPQATFVPTECHLWDLGKGIKEALHNVFAPQRGTNWRVLSNGYYHSVVEVFD